MKTDGIFEVVPGSLFSVRFAGESKHELRKVFELWNDWAYLESFFDEHYADLLAFWENTSVEEAVTATIDEAHKLEKALLRVAHLGRDGGFENLSTLFKPLQRYTCGLEKLERSKARGFRMHSWLRIYAIRLSVNHFVITGGAIKLTRTMNERAHLEEELRKLDAVREFLKVDQKDELGLFELF